MHSGLLLGKAFDCRLGCAAIIDVMEDLKGRELNVDLVAGFASQEEVGLCGAGVSANKIDADVAICFEGTPADDTFLLLYQQQTRVGAGPMLRHIDRTMITNPRFQRFCLDLAAEHDIPVQEGVREGGGTNAGAIHLARLGIPTVVPRGSRPVCPHPLGGQQYRRCGSNCRFGTPDHRKPLTGAPSKHFDITL